ncbi:unnamed protein product, partial [Nesidiocoris tenuis]
MVYLHRLGEFGRLALDMRDLQTNRPAQGRARGAKYVERDRRKEDSSDWGDSTTCISGSPTHNGFPTVLFAHLPTLGTSYVPDKRFFTMFTWKPPGAGPVLRGPGLKNRRPFLANPTGSSSQNMIKLCKNFTHRNIEV